MRAKYKSHRSMNNMIEVKRMLEFDGLSVIHWVIDNDNNYFKTSPGGWYPEYSGEFNYRLTHSTDNVYNTDVNWTTNVVFIEELMR
jgi:hypothetical protein